VTVDANGQLVEARNIPYMASGAVQPGGNWLAYSTEYLRGSYGPDPGIIYLLNLQNGQRWQVTEEGQGYGVYSWSPDGKWLLVAAHPHITDYSISTVLGADGLDWLEVSDYGFGDAVWSPDSKHFAYSVQLGGCEDSGCTPETSAIYLVDILARKFTEVTVPGAGQVMQPAWSPDGSRLLLLTFGGHCSPMGPCSGTAPAFYNIAVSSSP
jgi:Tol biopolymer transport system component